MQISLGRNCNVERWMERKLRKGEGNVKNNRKGVSEMKGGSDKRRGRDEEGK